MPLPDDNQDLYDRLATHMQGPNPTIQTYNPTGMPFESDYRATPIAISNACPIGHLTFLPNIALIHPRDVIRLDHPPGITGELNASLEWINRTIALAAQRATARLDRMYTNQPQGSE